MDHQYQPRPVFISPHLLSTVLRWAVVLLSILKAQMLKSFTRTTLSEQAIDAEAGKDLLDSPSYRVSRKRVVNVKLQIADLRTQ